MKLFQFLEDGRKGLGIQIASGEHRALFETDDSFPGDVDALLMRGPEELQAAGKLIGNKGRDLDPESVAFLPPVGGHGKIICIGLNYRDHSAESGFVQPEYPTVFARFSSSLIGHRAPIIRPRQSDQLDYEGELVAVIGKPGRNIPMERALDHVIGYSIFNDASIRDYQTKSPQWTVGKNFDDTGAFGPYLVTADALPTGASGLRLETRLNGAVMQSASTSDMVFSVAQQISLLSEAFTLETGDIFVTGTPSGVGLARNPQVWMKPGDECEVSIEGIGTLANSIRQG